MLTVPSYVWMVVIACSTAFHPFLAPTMPYDSAPAAICRTS